VGVWTIGYGSTLYRNNQPIHKGEVITEAIAEDLLEWEVTRKSTTVDGATKNVTLTQNQFNALTSFAYNVGIGGLLSSTLLKKVKANPNDPTIRQEFWKWDKGHIDGKLVELPGLLTRRKAEADLYFS